MQLADHYRWRIVALPGTPLLTRCAGRGGVLVDPGTSLALELLAQTVKHISRESFDAWPTAILRRFLGDLLAVAERISDELDDRAGI